MPRLDAPRIAKMLGVIAMPMRFTACFLTIKPKQNHALCACVHCRTNCPRAGVGVRPHLRQLGHIKAQINAICR